MLKNYLIILIRNLIRTPSFTIINKNDPAIEISNIHGSDLKLMVN